MTHCQTPEKRVLIVEDDDAVREALAIFLESERYTAVQAAHGEEALRHLRSSPPFCLIPLDLMMPVMNGWEFCAQPVKDPAIARVPVVVVTADNSAARKAADVGAAGYMLKPIEFPELLSHVERHC
jgi:CheY-like chemotaxis protein